MEERKLMIKDTKLKNALKELQTSTGLPLILDESKLSNPEQAFVQIRQLSGAYKEKYNADYFLQNLLHGKIPEFEIGKYASKLHIDTQKPRCLFLIEVHPSACDAATEILKNLFSSRRRQYIFAADSRTIAFLKTIREQEPPDDMERTARMIVDTLNMEAMTRVRVAYGGLFDRLFDLPEQYKINTLALQIGSLFYSEQTVLFSHRLGTGRLICGLPKPLCRSFLREIFGENPPGHFEEEILLTFQKFIRNNLNIAETARQLHVHRNTLIYRLEQLQKHTGLDIRRFEDAMTFQIAVMIINYLNAERKNSDE